MDSLWGRVGTRPVLSRCRASVVEVAAAAVMTMTTMMVMTLINRIMIIEAVPYSAHPPSVCRVQQSSLKGSRWGREEICLLLLFH